MELSLEIRIQNYDPTPMAIEATLVAPAAWVVAPSVSRLEVPARGTASSSVNLSIPSGWMPHASRFAIALDVVANGKHLGQIAEAICEVDGSAPNLESWA
jgi:hypothetical protein